MFEGARLKLKRADEHIAEVERRIDLVVSPDSQTSWRECDSRSRVQQINYRLNRIGDLPDIALVVGDAFHNLKTVFDYVWLETVTKLVPTAVSKYAKFPVYPSIVDLESALKTRHLDSLAPRLFNFILRDIKPYDGGDYAIWPIHKLDIMDKHRLLIPTTNYGNIEGLKVKDQHGKVHIMGSWGDELKGEFKIAIAPNLEIENNGRAVFEIIFKEGPAETMEVNETLRIYSGMVFHIVKLFEKLIET